MKRILFGLLLSLLALQAFAAPTFFWRMEGTTLDGTHDFTAGDSTAALNSLAAINTDAVRIGTNGLDCPTSSDHAQFDVSSGDLISQSVGSLGFWFRLQSFTSGASLFRAHNTGTINNHIQVELSGTDDATGREIGLRIRLNLAINAVLVTTDADLQLDTWYRLVVRWDEPNSDRRIEVYNDDGAARTSIEDLTTDFDQPTGINTMFVGDATGGTLDLHMDNFVIANAYNEPIEDNLTITSYTAYGGGASGLLLRRRRN